MLVTKLSNQHTTQLEEFCDKCREAGYYNNSSLELMKWGKKYDLPDVADFWGLIVDGKIVSISGYHSFGQYDPIYPQARCLFRSATLPEYSNIIPGISKNHMNSVPFSLLLPHQLAHAINNKFKHFFLTTSSGNHDSSGKMYRTHRVMQLLSKQEIVTVEAEEIVYSTAQTKWRIRLKQYLTAIKSFEETRFKLNIEEDYENAISTINNFIKEE
jgi:hypothetical protein